MIKERDFAGLKQCFSDWPPADLAELIADLPVEEQVVVFRMLPHELAGATFEYLSHHTQHALLHAMGREDVVKLINDMSPDDRTSLLEELPGSAVKQLLQLLSPEQLAVAQSLLAYPEKSVGRLMTPDFISVHDDWTVKEVLDHVREHGHDRETLNVIYVTDQEGKLIDDVRIREFLLQPLDRKVADIRDSNFIALKVRDSEADAINLFKRYDRTVLPVVDSDARLIGIVTVDDILDVAEKETTEDIQKMGGMEALDAPYLSISLFSMIKKRAGWLSLLFLGEMLTATAMGYFQDEIERAVVLALFVPLIISSGGNSGSQATSLIIRSFAVRDVLITDWWRVFRREMMAGLALGSVLAVIATIRILIWPHHAQLYGPHFALVAATVAFSLIGVVLFGSLSGSMLPFVLRKVGFDPAVCSAPFVATLVDVTGLVIYFTIASSILGTTLLARPNPNVIRFGQERTTRGTARLMHLNDDWEVKDVDLIPKDNRINIAIDPTEHLLSTKCPNCGGHLSEHGAATITHTSYLDWFDYKTQIDAKIPQLQCDSCGKPFAAAAPVKR
ncbi:MAG: mgtE [Verrucomicrobiales bacterium]|nr:mgtE [Verrucomicrobiales bacterium]